MVVPEGHETATGEAKPLGEMLFFQDHAAIEGVDEEWAFRGLVLDDEVAREAHPLNIQAGVSGDLHVDDGKGDGYADLPVYYVVEEAVAGVVVLLLVASEAFFVEKDVVEGLDGGHDGIVRGVGADAEAKVFDYL